MQHSQNVIPASETDWSLKTKTKDLGTALIFSCTSIIIAALSIAIFFPLTYDNLHDHCNPSIFEGNQITIQQNIDAFAQTWPEPFTPVFHWSWGCEDKNAAMLIMQKSCR